MLLNKAGQVFVGRRIDRVAEAWQMPQGGIDDGEDPRAAAFRELEEEVGTANAEILAESANWLDYDLPPELVGQIWRGRYRGQRQKWFAMRFKGSDGDIDLGRKHAEFDAWRWIAMDGLPDVIVPFKKDLYRRLVSEFRYLVVQ